MMKHWHLRLKIRVAVRIKWLYVRNFRGFDDLGIEFTPGINEIVGRNAQGKTSLLEAIYLCMTGSSFRTSVMRDLIRYDQEGFFVEIGFEKEGVSYELQFSFDGQKRRIFLNGRSCDSIASLIGQLLGVICTPEVQNLVKGAPAVRRHFLDLCLAQIDPLYVHHLSRYSKALKQRNALLKAKDVRTIGVWEKELAHSASYITRARVQITQVLRPRLAKCFSELSQNEMQAKELDLAYDSKAPCDNIDETRIYFEQEFIRKRFQEIAFGSTLVGPHRDDMLIFMGKKAAREFASEGEMRLIALSLKLAEWQHVKELVEFEPLLLIDDFGAYLDKERASRLFGMICTFGQVFISTHTANPAQTQAPSKLKTFFIEAGKLV